MPALGQDFEAEVAALLGPLVVLLGEEGVSMQESPEPGPAEPTCGGVAARNRSGVLFIALVGA